MSKNTDQINVQNPPLSLCTNTPLPPTPSTTLRAKGIPICVEVSHSMLEE